MKRYVALESPCYPTPADPGDSITESVMPGLWLLGQQYSMRLSNVHAAKEVRLLYMTSLTGQ